MARMTEAQRQMLLESDPDDVTGEEGVGVELRTGAGYAVARALERRGLGHVTGPGGSLPGMYWNNSDGLTMRAAEMVNPCLSVFTHEHQIWE